MTTDTLDFGFELKRLDEDDEGVFEGYASVFGETDYTRDIVEQGAFKRTLREHRKKGRLPALLWQHDSYEPIGVWDEMKEDGHGLAVKGRLLIDDAPKARQAHALLKENGLSGMSIGYRTQKSLIDEKKKVRKLLDVDLFEVSLVTFPALDSARVSAVKSDDIKTIRDFEAFLRDAGGFSNAAAKRIATQGFKAEADHRDDAVDANHVNDVLDAFKRGTAIIQT